MKIKTLTGSSIHAALIEARRLFGDDVVLLESIPAEGDSPARITVMVDTPVLEQSKKKVPAARKTVPAEDGVSVGYGYTSTSDVEPNVSHASKGGARFTAQPSNISYNGPAPQFNTSIPEKTTSYPYPSRRANMQVSHPRNRIFTEDDQESFLPVKADQLQELLEAQLSLIHNRLDRLDRRFEEAIVGASIQWTSQELFTRLLRQGMRPSTVTRLFEQLMAKGLEPGQDEQKMRWALAHEIRNLLQSATPKRYTGTIMFIGPSGSGKTTLLLKVAKHPSFFGRHKTTIISIMPEGNKDVPYQNPAPLFTEYGVPVQTVGNIEEMLLALDRASRFDQILIDTPPMPVHESRARKMLLSLKRIIEPLLPIQVHLVLNATRALDEFDLSYIQRLPIRPDAIAFTHLDETQGLGRLAEWMIQTKLPVQFASSSPIAPDGVGAFTPSWFVEEMMRIL